MNIDSLLEHAQKALQDGHVWRAKEILQSGVRTRPYHLELFERLGLVLLQMGDELEAGKYLFLAGSQESSHREPIRLFINRYSRSNPLQLYHAFPRAARLGRRADYPRSVETELAKLALPEMLPAPAKPPKITTPNYSLGSKTLEYGYGAIWIAMLGFAVLGLASMIQWIRSWTGS